MTRSNDIRNPAVLRAAVAARATDLDHPTKHGLVPTRLAVARGLADKPHPWGRLVSFDNGQGIGGLFDGDYLIARSEDDVAGIEALAHFLGIRKFPPDEDVFVEHVSAEWFWVACLPPDYEG